MYKYLPAASPPVCRACRVKAVRRASAGLLSLGHDERLNHQPGGNHRRALPEGGSSDLEQEVATAQVDRLLGRCLRLDQRHCRRTDQKISRIKNKSC